MAGDLETVKTIATVAAPFTTAIIDTWIKPKLAALAKYFKTDKALSEHSLVSRFDEYMLRTYEKNSYVSVLAFQNQQKKLEEIYIPLTVKETRSIKQVKIDSYKKEFLPTFKKVLISDTAGMGKSTIQKYLFLSCIKQNEGIPVFIELRKLKENESILDYIFNEINPIDDEFDKDFVLKLIKQGDFIFFLDGYDEIPFIRRDEVTRYLQDFISKAGNNFFILTSRPESSLASFSDFQEFSIKPLELDEAFELLKKYDKGGELSSEIINRLQDDELKNIQEFLQNPLLVSLLYKSYEYKPTIPFKKHIFYRQVYDALFESHDLTKGGAFIRSKHSGLDIEDFHRVLRALGFITVKLGQVEYDKDTLLSLLAKAKENCSDLVFKESDYLRDILITVPIFSRDGNYFRWSHKSIQEYFAAQFIWIETKGHQARILQQMVRSENNENYYSVLEMFYDIDYKTFRHAIIYDYICDFLKHYDSYLMIKDEQVSKEDLHYRKLITFNKKIFLAGPEILQKLRDNEDQYNYHFIGSDLQSLLPELEVELKGYKLFAAIGDYIINFFNNQKMISNILGEKKESFILRNRDSKLAKTFARKFKEHQSKRDTNEAYISKRLTTPLIEVNDDPSYFFNQAEFFAEMNLILFGDSPATEYWLDPKACRRLKLEIEKEMAREATGDFLFGNI